MSTNLIASRIKERYDRLDPTTQKELDTFFKEKSSNYRLNVIKKSRQKPAEGDVFVLSPREGIYFFGKVMVANIVREVPDSFVEGKHVIFIFKGCTNEITIDNFVPNYEDLLISPAIVSDDYWKKGYFYTISNIPLTEVEKNLDFGFYKIHFKGNFFCKETGEILDREPKILGMHGITTLTGIATEVERELIIDSTLLTIPNIL